MIKKFILFILLYVAAHHIQAMEQSSDDDIYMIDEKTMSDEFFKKNLNRCSTCIGKCIKKFLCCPCTCGQSLLSLCNSNDSQNNEQTQPQQEVMSESKVDLCAKCTGKIIARILCCPCIICDFCCFD